MTPDGHPAVVAYDGSPPARAAVRLAAALFADRTLVVASVWEPGLAMGVTPARDPTGLSQGLPSAEEMATIDRVERDEATSTAEEGAQLAREHGASALALAIPDERDAAATIAAVAEEHDACVIVVGSRGLGRVASQILGSTSRTLLRRSSRPVLVVKAPD